MAKFITSEQIITELKEYITCNSNKSFIELLPHLIIFLEVNYKQIKGIDKRKLLIDAIISLNTSESATENERNVLVSNLTTQINNLVYMANNHKDLFKKLKKKKCKFC